MLLIALWTAVFCEVTGFLGVFGSLATGAVDCPVGALERLASPLVEAIGVAAPRQEEGG